MNKKRNSLISQIHKTRLYQGFIALLKRKTLPGFYRVSIYHTLKLAWKEAMDKDIYTRSLGVAYSVFLSLFPFIILIFSIISLLPEANIIAYIETAVEDIMPANAESFLMDTVKSIIDMPRGGLLSVGFILALYFSSNAMMILIQGFDKNYERTFKSRSWIKQKAISIGITFVIGILLIISIGLIMVGDYFIRLLFLILGQSTVLSVALFSVKWVVVILSFLTAMGIIYRFGPAMKWKFQLFSPGAIIATVFCLVTSGGFSLFVNNFGTYNKVYGSIGAIIAIMVWIQLNCLIVLLGYEVNASIALNRDLDITLEQE